MRAFTSVLLTGLMLTPLTSMASPQFTPNLQLPSTLPPVTRPMPTLPADRIKIFRRLSGTTATSTTAGETLSLSPAHFSLGSEHAYLLMQRADVGPAYVGPGDPGVARFAAGGVLKIILPAGKTFLVDCEIHDTASLNFTSGAASGVLTVTGGHVLFVATSPMGSTPFGPASTLYSAAQAPWGFTGCEATPMS